jgi:hypothetical protein
MAPDGIVEAGWHEFVDRHKPQCPCKPEASQSHTAFSTKDQQCNNLSHLPSKKGDFRNHGSNESV